MRPSLRQIQYFVEVADCGAFGPAAANLGVTQPSLSKQLAAMEEELGAKLFERTSRKVTITPLGRVLLKRARALLHDAQEFRAVARGSIGLFGDRLSLGVLPSVGAYFMPVANRRLHSLFPDLRLVVQEAATTVLLDKLTQGEIDAVIGTKTNEPGIVSLPLFTETLWICAASDDPLSQGSGPVTLQDLTGRPLLALSPEFRLADTVERLAQEAGCYVSRDYQGGSLDAVRQMAVMGAGVAVLPSLYALAEAVRDPEFKVRKIEHKDAVHPIYLHWRRASPMRKDFERLAELLVEVKNTIRAAREGALS